MRIATATSDHPDFKVAVREAMAEIHSQLNSSPHFLVVYTSILYGTEDLARELRLLAPGTLIHGGTSCRGVMSERGFCSSPKGFGLGLFAIHDEVGAYGVGGVEVNSSAHDAAIEAARLAVAEAKRMGESPALVWLTSPPGLEEEVISGLMDFFGPNVPVFGGSSADEEVTGRWAQFTHLTYSTHSVVVSVLYPPSRIAFAFQGGYDATETSAVVTRGHGRLIEELNGRPAAEVYNEWAGGALTEVIGKEANVLMKTSLHPLGRLIGRFGGIPYYQLSHPDTVTANRGLTVFTNIEQGETVFLMTGTEEALVTRSRRIVESALRNVSAKDRKIEGALLVYCAGCMLTVRHRMSEVVSNLKAALGEKTPFLGAFTFGEQGSFLGGENRHGNLMISIVLFLR